MPPSNWRPSVGTETDDCDPNVCTYFDVIGANQNSCFGVLGTSLNT